MSIAFLLSAAIQFGLGLVVAWLLGPAEFGLYALALASAVVAQTLAFEWIRLAATRFHHAGAGHGVTRSLGLAFWVIGAVVVLVALLAGVFVKDRPFLFMAVPLIGLAGGLADFRAALMRAEFDQRGYAGFMLLRNLLAIVATPLAVHLYGHAEAGLIAFGGSLAVATGVAACWRWWQRRRQPSGPSADMPLYRDLLAYALPIVATNGLYLLMFLGLRAGVAAAGDMAAAGQFSLALEFCLKLFTTFGSALDLILFQQALAALRAEGDDAGSAALRRNVEIILGLLVPMAVGLALVLPGIEALLVAPDYRGIFGHYAAMLIAGVLVYCLVQYAVHPFFQLRHRTLPLAQAAAGGGTAAVFVFAAGQSLGLALPILAGLAVLAGAMGSLALLLRLLGGQAMPSGRFVIRLLASVGAMALAVVPFRLGLGAPAMLATAVGAGALTYLGAALILDLGGIRAFVRTRGKGSA